MRKHFSHITRRNRAVQQMLIFTVILLAAVSVFILLKNSSASAAIPPSTAGSPTPTAQARTLAPTRTQAATRTVVKTSDPGPTAPTNPLNIALGADGWKELPVLPVVSRTARAIYQQGLALGNDPHAFSKVGDCNSLPPTFLTNFDSDPLFYNLGAYTDLQPVIVQFSGSFARQGFALGDGFNTSTVLAPFRADPDHCGPNETPLACEYRIQKPSFAIIAVGTDDYVVAVKFEANLRKIIETTIHLGIVPILATKVDDANQLNFNAIIARLAVEYDVPLWNLWRAVQTLPNSGLDDDIHPSGTVRAFDFSPDFLARYGWPVRNLTALQALYTTWRSVTQP
jgi:hypothetical protein